MKFLVKYVGNNKNYDNKRIEIYTYNNNVYVELNEIDTIDLETFINEFVNNKDYIISKKLSNFLKNYK